jgi:hypothetical protein
MVIRIVLDFYTINGCTFVKLDLTRHLLINKLVHTQCSKRVMSKRNKERPNNKANLGATTTSY